LGRAVRCAGQSRRGDETNRTTLVRKSDRELVITRIFDAPARVVFKAWTTADVFKQWWAPKSMEATLRSVEMDVRTGGGYRIEFVHPQAPEPFAFYGKYLEVTPPSRLVWTNAESDQGAITTVTFEEKGGKTHLTLGELYPTKAALDEAVSGMESMDEQFLQLDEVLATLT
jgi:uncharacterized protein YndB with AHSA1/START domain